MPETTTIEARVQSLEREVEMLKRRLPTAGSGASWIDEIAGSMESFPEFNRVVELGREARRSDRLDDPAK